MWCKDNLSTFKKHYISQPWRVYCYKTNSMNDPQVNKTLTYLRQVETVAQEVLAKKHLKIELSNGRNKFNEAYRALQKSDENHAFLKCGSCYLRFPKDVAIDVLKEDIKTSTEEIDELHEEIRRKVSDLRELEHQPGIVGFGLKPLSGVEARAISKGFGDH